MADGSHPLQRRKAVRNRSRGGSLRVGSSLDTDGDRSLRNSDSSTTSGTDVRGDDQTTTASKTSPSSNDNDALGQTGTNFLRRYPTTIIGGQIHTDHRDRTNAPCRPRHAAKYQYGGHEMNGNTSQSSSSGVGLDETRTNIETAQSVSRREGEGTVLIRSADPASIAVGNSAPVERNDEPLPPTPYRSMTRAPPREIVRHSFTEEEQKIIERHPNCFQNRTGQDRYYNRQRPEE